MRHEKKCVLLSDLLLRFKKDVEGFEPPVEKMKNQVEVLVEIPCTPDVIQMQLMNMPFHVLVVKQVLFSVNQSAG